MKNPNFELAFIDLRLRLLEKILLQQNQSNYDFYLNELRLFRTIIDSEGGAGKDTLLSLIDEHITYFEKFPPK